LPAEVYLTGYIVVATLWNIELLVSLVETHPSIYKCTTARFIAEPVGFVQEVCARDKLQKSCIIACKYIDLAIAVHIIDLKNCKAVNLPSIGSFLFQSEPAPTM